MLDVRLFDQTMLMGNEAQKGAPVVPDGVLDMFTAAQLKRLQDAVDRPLTLDEVNECARLYEQAQKGAT